MQLLSQWMIGNALTASVLALAALAIGRLLPRRPALVHACWLLVLLKLVTPPFFWVPVFSPVHTALHSEPSSSPSSDVRAKPDLKPETVATVPQPEELTEWDAFELVQWLESQGVYDLPVPMAQKDEAQAITQKEAALSPALASETATKGTSSEAGSALRDMGALLLDSGSAWLVWISLAGSGAFCWLTGRRIVAMQRLLRWSEPVPEALWREWNGVKHELQIAQGPSLCLVDARVGPLLWQGWGSPVVVFPIGLVERISRTELRTILAHELNHYRRGDHLWRYLEFAALAMYWWLPFAWLASRRLRQAEEECCDAGVVATQPELAASYATALVRSLSFVTEPSSPCPVLTSGLGPVSLLKRRLTMMRQRVERRLGLRGWLMLLALAGLVLPVGLTWAGDDDPPKQPARPASQARESERARRTGQDQAKRPLREQPDDPVPPQPPMRAATPPPAMSMTTPLTPMAGGMASEEMRGNLEMAVKQAELEVKVRRVKVRQAESAVKLQATDLGRIRELVKSAAAPQSEQAMAEARLENAQTDVELAKIELERAELGVEQARRRMASFGRMGGGAGFPTDGGPVGPGAPGRPGMGGFPPGGGGVGGAAAGGPGGQFGPFGGRGEMRTEGRRGDVRGDGRGEGRGEGRGDRIPPRDAEVPPGVPGAPPVPGAAALPSVPGGGVAAPAAPRSARAAQSTAPSKREAGDPRDERIQQLERELREMRRQLEEMRRKGPDGQAAEAR